ncbi:MAG: hypothetical protein Ct9H90mP6_01010 [Gammaproteobacteria bacterium]|nr:MAG: hypothetical protein Ct9H90mP6_01010 [Gammaproteobacteria bacterium]
MDVIALHEKGIKNAVATLGTAVTSNHLSKLMRYSNNIFFAFDGDLAGEKAAWKALQNVLPIIREDTRIKFVFLRQVMTRIVMLISMEIKVLLIL